MQECSNPKIEKRKKPADSSGKGEEVERKGRWRERGGKEGGRGRRIERGGEKEVERERDIYFMA